MMAVLGGRKRTTLLLAALLLISICACALQETRALAYGATAEEEEEDDDDDDDDGEFDFMSAKLATPARRVEEEVEAACDAAGECAAPAFVRSVLDRGLVTPKPRVKELLREHARAATDAPAQRAFAGEALGYVTPWNGRGYDFARQFRTKFAFIAPVWLQIREDGKTKKPILTGTHDVDRAWVRDVRGSDDSGPKIVPRVMYERNTLSSEDVPVIIELLLALADKETLDGFVFEIPIVAGTMDLLLRVGEAFKTADKLLLLVITRSANDGRLPVTHEMLDQLAPFVHRYTMNAYDFQTPGPNAPFDWIRATLDRFREQDKAKLLIGLPFYGYDNNDAIVGAKYIEQLQQYDSVKIRWDAAAHECFHQYESLRDGSRHTVYFPCLQFLHDRLRLFHESGVAGAAVWELGQGLEFFYDLL